MQEFGGLQALGRLRATGGLRTGARTLGHGAPKATSRHSRTATHHASRVVAQGTQHGGPDAAADPRLLLLLLLLAPAQDALQLRGHQLS